MTDVDNDKFLTIVEKFPISPHDRCKKLKFTLFCCKISWLMVYAVLRWNLFCRDLRAFCVEKNWSQKCAMWRKNDKYDVWGQPCSLQILPGYFFSQACSSKNSWIEWYLLSMEWMDMSPSSPYYGWKLSKAFLRLIWDGFVIRQRAEVWKKKLSCGPLSEL